jgi:hypothetical protein
VALAAVVVLAGCSAVAGSSHAGHGQDTVPSAGAPTTLPTTGADLYSSCTTPDADGGNAELTSVELVAQDGQLVLAFNLAKPVTGELRLEADFGAGHDPAATPAAKKFTVEIGLQDGRPSEAVVRTPSGATSPSQPGDVVHVMENIVHVGLPAGILQPLGSQWHWKTAASTGSSTVACPAAAVGAGVVAVG